MNIESKYLETQAQLFKMIGVEPVSGFVETDGPVRRIRYLKLGSGDPLVMVHGGFSHASEWLDLLKPLSEKFTLYVPDRPGHGLSDPIDYTGKDYAKSAAEFLRSFLDAVGLNKARLLGNSMGAYFSIQFALAYPERVEKLILIGAPAGMNHWIPGPIRLMAVPVLGSILARTIGRPSVEGQKQIHRKIIVHSADKIPDLYFEHCYYAQGLPGAEVAHRTLAQAVITWRGWRKERYMGDQLHRLKVPVGFIWGDKDVFEGPDTGREKAKTVKNYEFEVVKDAGHCPWFDKPERCAELIVQMAGK